MPMYNLIEYSDKYSDTSGSLWDFKRDEIVNNESVTNDNNPSSFKYKASLIANTETNGTKKGVKIAILLKYLSNFWRSLKNFKIELSLKWIENCETCKLQLQLVLMLMLLVQIVQLLK